MIDLHCHSYFSDGALSPEALLARAVDVGIRVLALTDHDTTNGLMPLQNAAIGHDITIINGIELSARWKKYDIHIIGLQINPDDEQLQHLIVSQNKSRIERAIQIGACLENFGILNAYQKACKIAGHERVGRPHFARVLIDEGKVSDMKSAFKRLLGKGKPAFVPTLWASIDEVVSGIVQAGGQAVIAHPLKYSLTRSKLHEFIKAFKEAGGRGIEVVSGEMTTLEINQLMDICVRFDLLASSGSDFHSDTGSRIGLGRQKPLPVNCVPIWQQWNV